MYEYGSKEWEKEYKEIVEKRKEIIKQPYLFITPEWCSNFEYLIQNDLRYKEVAKKWEGSVVLVIKTESESILVDNFFLFLELWHGECKYAKLVPENAGRNGDYVLEADYNRWRRILKGELNVVKELATQNVKLMPFNFKKALKLAAAAQAAVRLVFLASKVNSLFFEDLDSSQLDLFKSFRCELKSILGI